MLSAILFRHERQDAYQLEQIHSLLNQGNQPAAQHLLAQAIQREPRNPALWLPLESTLEDIERRQYCLTRALLYDPFHHEARTRLHALITPTKSTPIPPPAKPRMPIAATPTSKYNRMGCRPPPFPHRYLRAKRNSYPNICINGHSHAANKHSHPDRVRLHLIVGLNLG